MKMDGCFADPLAFDEGYPTVTRALNESGRHIVFSCSWPAYLVWGGIKVLGVKKRFITRKFLIQASPAIRIIVYNPRVETGEYCLIWP